MASAINPPIRLAVIGAGDHSRTFHLPALQRFRSAHSDLVTLAALVDPDSTTAKAMAARYEFESVHAHVEELLARNRPDACLALTPVAFNARIATQLAREGLPVLMEKPLGKTIAEARQLVADLAALNARVMVSMNRRFDPLLRSALDWIGSRPIRHIKAMMARQARTEPQFIEHTGLHVVDAVCSIGGEVVSCEPRRHASAKGDWFQAELAFAVGATASIDLMPTAGIRSESIKITGDDYRVEIRSAEFDRGGWRAWSGNRLECDEILPAALPLFVANGTFAETEAFIHCLRTGGAFAPTPADVLPAMEICHRIEETPATSPILS